MREVFIHNVEPYYTREATAIFFKTINSTYSKANLDKVAAAEVQLYENQREILLSLLTEFDDLFDGTIGKLDTTTINLEAKPGYKMFNYIYYLMPNINKETSHKDIQHLVEIGVLNSVQNTQYGTTVFIIPNKEGTARFIMDY